MTITTRRVTGPIVLPDGGAPQNCRATLALSGPDSEGTTRIIEGPIAVWVLDGTFDADLWCTDTGDAGRVYVGLLEWHDGREKQARAFVLDVPSGAGDLPFAPVWSGTVPESTQADALAQCLAAAASAADDAEATVEDRAVVEAAAAVMAGVRAYGAIGDGVVDDTAAFAAALSDTSGPVLVPWSAQHYALTSLTGADRSRLYGPGKLVVAGVVREISRGPRVGDDRPGWSIVDHDWRPIADFAAVDTEDGPFLMDVQRRGSTVGSYGWVLLKATMPDQKVTGMEDHIFTIWANPALVTGPETRTNGAWIGVNTPASNIAGQGGTTPTGISTGVEINAGNLRADLGIRTQFGDVGEVTGLVIAPDVNPSPLGVNYWDVANITISAPGVVTITGHNFTNNMSMRVYAKTGTLPGGLTDGEVYWIVNVSGNTLQLSATPGGTPITTTGSFAAGVRVVPSYPAPHGLVFAKSIHHHQIGVPITVAPDTIQNAGHLLVAHGGSGAAVRPSNLVLMQGHWVRAFDTTGATFASGMFAVLGDNQSLRWGASTGAGIRGTTGILDLSPGGASVGRLLTNGFVGSAALQWSSAGLGFYGAEPHSKLTITGSRGGNAALASLLDALEALGLVTDATT